MPMHARHPPEQRCEYCEYWPAWAHLLEYHLFDLSDQIEAQGTSLRRKITEGAHQVTESNQAHLDRATAEIRASVATAVQELKDAIAAGTPPAQLDFTALDQLSSDEAAEAAADAPPAPPA